ncbi:hypothetical protein BG53_08525 [Paenibacillus darwinianus]|uniref:protein acetyllysine N-acetyltransferase n=1 Tax=Paenibacillus darwinianus TaxID=1380763 RepID=A0A9W5W875_9BACL|nr:Sir2 family NAD-dependent protein deacetylase [Paenibacillus darwinianus]EXX91281.1 hypothetical protein CH50_13830 [Paenibacillus darwinianus]EXX91821.1 hypothetical protein BG53_08525 [Paenibacillus darwinianus]EXX92472.1 hypothetical protein BG52_12315 [Paenibacillus darwinianus]
MDFGALRKIVGEVLQFADIGGGVPKCGKCGGIVKPDVVLYEEALDGNTLEAAVAYIGEADVLIVGGTSLT